jgi:PAS domain S-box-containing protein
VHIFQQQRRAVIDLVLGMLVAFCLVILNLSTSFLDRIYRYIETYSRHDPAHWIANLVFFWLIALLWLAFCQWRAASRQRQELENIISSISPDALLVVEPDRRIAVCNHSVQRLFGYEPREIIGQKTDMLYFDRRSSPSSPHEIYEALQRDGFHLGLATGVRKDGSKMPLEIIAGDLSGRRGAVLLLRDIQERVRAAEEQRKLEERMWRRQKLESLGVLSSGIAHDFNNLLMAILGNADLASMELAPDSPHLARIEGIKSAAKCASELCDQILSYSGKTSVMFKPINLSAVVREIGDLLSVSVPRKAEMQYDLKFDLPLIKGDPTQVRQVVMNLITNAAESLSEEGGTIAVCTGIMDCDSAYLRGTYLDEDMCSGQYVFLRVSDNGCGIDPETRAKIFDPFFTTKFNGRGLGLAAVLGIVRAHRGALKVDSELGKGSVFTILLPFEDRRKSQGESTEQGGAASDGTLARVAWTGKGKVLLADDDQMVLDIARMMLEQIGFDVLVAKNGKNAVKLFEADSDAIVLCLLDVKMPVMSGDEAAEAIRRIRPDVPLILSSGYAEEPSETGEFRKYSGFIHKPYELSALRDQLRIALET